MKIKNVREPSDEEKKNILPKVILFGVTTAIVTSVIYLITFYSMDIGESMYLAGKIASTKTAAEHDVMIKLFEAVYGRDYMTNRFEGLSISFLASIVAEAACGIIYKAHTIFKGVRR